ncbi:MAG: hypothetical protein RL226_204 [Bacteroidota bacterium]|jgi:hypothetical protein
MKKVTILSAFVLFASLVSAQFVRLEVEEVPNDGLVPGKTYRVYAVMTNQNDVIDAVFADKTSSIQINSTAPIYQHPKGGFFANTVQRMDVSQDRKLKYDSWFTIGAEDNYNNYLTPFMLDSSYMKTFEAGKSFTIAGDGAWFVTPDQRQARADAKGRILLMQITTKGKVTGTLNIHGRTADTKDAQGNQVPGTPFEKRGVQITIG